MRNSITVAAALIAAVLISGCVTIQNNQTQNNTAQPDTSISKAFEGRQKALQAREVVQASLANRGITDFEVFVSPKQQEVIVEYFGNHSPASNDEELGYVAAAAALAYPQMDTVEVHRFIGNIPEKKAVAKTDDALETIAGHTKFEDFVSNQLKVSDMQQSDAITSELEKASLEETAKQLGQMESPARPTAPAALPTSTATETPSPWPVASVTPQAKETETAAAQQQQYVTLDISSWLNEPHTNAFPEAGEGYKYWFLTPTQTLGGVPFGVVAAGGGGNEIASFFPRASAVSKIVTVSTEGAKISSVYLLASCGWCAGLPDPVGYARFRLKTGQVMEKRFNLMEWSKGGDAIASFYSTKNIGFEGNLYVTEIKLDSPAEVNSVEVRDDDPVAQLAVAAMTVKTVPG